jgi:hypothetical protein
MKPRWIRQLIVVFLLAFGTCTLAEEGRPARSGEGDPKNLWVYKEAVALGIPEPEMTNLVEECKGRGFTTAEIQRMLGLVARAKLSGLPHKALLFKLREGLAKNASPELIDAALAGNAQTLKKSKGIVDNLIVEGYATRDYELAIQIVADALDAGLSQQAVTGLIREGGEPPEGLPNPGALFIPFEVRNK